MSGIRVSLRFLPALLLFCLLTVSSNAAVAMSAENSAIDRRVLDSISHSSLSILGEGQYRPRNDFTERPYGGCGTGYISGEGEARRASNLIASKHYVEAVEELTKAIASYDLKNRPSLNPSWLLKRAELLRILGLNQQAMNDIRIVTGLKDTSTTLKFQCALLLIQLGEDAEAECALSSIAESDVYSYGGFERYILGLAQENQGRRAEAISNFRKAAILFYRKGLTEQANACLDSIKKLGGQAPVLRKPNSNLQKIHGLITAAMTRSDLFELDKLKEFIGASQFAKFQTGFKVHPIGEHYKELTRVNIDRLPTGGLRLFVQFDTSLCAIDRAVLTPFIEQWVESRNEYSNHIEEYRVPSGTAIFCIQKSGFKPISNFYVYSRDAQYPPKYEQNSTPVSFGSRYSNILAWLRIGEPARAEHLVDLSLRDEPDSAGALAMKADFLAERGEFEEAICFIDKAIESRKDREVQSLRSGIDGLLVKRGGYLLGMGKSQEALDEMNRGIPSTSPFESILPEEHLLRGRAELKLKKYPEALSDLFAARKVFFRSGRILKRDEVDRILQTVPKSALSSTSDPEIRSAMEDIYSKLEDPEYLDKQKVRLAKLLETAEETKKSKRIESIEAEKEAERKKEEDLSKDEERLAESLRAESESKLSRKKDPERYILALLTLASYWHEKRDDEKAMSYVDKALDVFETYVPNPEFDTCNGALLARLKFSVGLDRVYRVIERSEKLCTDERFRVQRDKEFMDFIEGRRSDAIAL